MTGSFRLACLQLNSGADMAANLAQIETLARAARAAGADIVATPENSTLMEQSSERIIAAGRTEEDHPGLAALRGLAAEIKAWIVIGSLWIKAESAAGRVVNRSFLISPDGQIKARYDKLHLFDVDLPGGEVYRESRSMQAGEKLVAAATPFGKIGLTVCYDVRFPELYRRLAQMGAELIGVPSAFTAKTGVAHWHVLLRARAIETGSYIFAPAQTGSHPGGRQTYGHSLIINPWGEVLADGGEKIGYSLAEIDLGQVARARAAIPAWKLHRTY
jgi:predicted amidohydrolase